MKITIFTSNQARHINLINSLSKISDECYAIMEVNTVFPGQLNDFFKKTNIMQEYFTNVMAAEKRLFGDVSFLNKSTKSLIIKSGDLNKLSKSILEPALNSDLYIVFGSSFIKGWLIDHLVKNKALNIHMGVSPYYRGSSCNFWALYDSNPHLVGATIHMLSTGLDSGDILYHVMPSTINCKNPFDFTMMTVLSAHNSIIERIKTKQIFDYKPIKQNKSLEIRYSTNLQFTDTVVKQFLDRNTSISEIKSMLNTKFNRNDYYLPYKTNQY